MLSMVIETCNLHTHNFNGNYSIVHINNHFKYCKVVKQFTMLLTQLSNLMHGPCPSNVIKYIHGTLHCLLYALVFGHDNYSMYLLPRESYSQIFNIINVLCLIGGIGYLELV